MTDQAATAGDSADFLNRFFKRGEVWLGLGLMVILTVLVLPIPPIMVDFGLAISITFAVIILMTVLFIGRPLEFSAFPTVSKSSFPSPATILIWIKHRLLFLVSTKFRHSPHCSG